MKTKLQSKFLSILLVLVMVLALVPFASLTAFAEDEENVLASAIVTIPIPEDGETSTGGKIFDSEKYNVSIGWSTTADGSVENDFNNQTFVAGNTYYVDLYLVAQDPYIFADGATVFVNGQAYTAVWTIGADYKKYVAVYDVPFTATEYIEKKFTLMPTGKMVGLNQTYDVTWETNFAADEYKVLKYNVNNGTWDEYATVPYAVGVNNCEVVSDKAVSHIFKVQAIKGGNVVLEAPQFTVTWSADFQVSFLPNGGSGTMDPVFITGKYMLPYCSFDAPEGYRFSHWAIGNEKFGQYADVTVTESIVVVAQWLPTINCLPLEIDGSAMADMKTPESARLKNYLPKNEQMYYCDGKYCCGMSKASDTWYDAETDEPATEFVDGRTYYYHIGVHPANGYLLPVITEQEAKNIAMISGIEWRGMSASTMSSDNYNKQCYEADFYLIYDEEKGIPAESRTEIDELHIDASNLAGATEPTKIDPSKLESEIFYPCGEGCTECDDEIVAMNQVWFDINNENIVNKFIDGHQYGFYLFFHLKPGYKCPNTVPENFLTLDGVQWEATMCEGFGNAIAFYGMITYSSETGIPAVPHECEPIYVERVKPTCTEIGFEAHYACECGKNFEDAEGTVEIPDLVAWGAIDATGHDYGTTWETDANEHWNKCAYGDKANKAAHTDDNSDGLCDVCAYQMSTESGDSQNPEDTNTPEDTTANDDTDNGSGCKSSLGTSAIVMVAITGLAGFSVTRKKKSNGR